MTTADRVARIAALGFTARQSAFLTAVMLHAGVCVRRQYATAAGIAHGQVIQDFFEKLVERRFATAYACGGRAGRLFHVHHKALYRAIGQPDSRYRRRGSVTRAIERLMVLDAVLAERDTMWLATEREKVDYFVAKRGLAVSELPGLTFQGASGRTVRHFTDKLPIGLSTTTDQVTLLYPLTEPSGHGLRTFLDSHHHLLSRLSRWRLLLAVPRALALAEPAHLRVIDEFIGAPVRPAVLEEFKWYCGVRRALDQRDISAPVDVPRYARARQAFGAPRFFATYRRWCQDGDAGLHRLLSPTLHDARQRGNGVIGVLELPYVYSEFGGVVATS